MGDAYEAMEATTPVVASKSRAAKIRLQVIQKLLKHLEANGGRLSIVWDPDMREDKALVGYEFGKEAEDSDMAGGASYAAEATIEAALLKVAGEVLM